MTNAIFIFTKDRPATLNKTLCAIGSSDLKKYVIDDSALLQNQLDVANICNLYQNCIYLGKKEFNEFLTRYAIELPKFSFLLREVGNCKWNLGFARNFALFYAKSLRLKKILFCDDDIEVKNIKLIDELFDKLNNYQFSGAVICGLADHSLVGHISTNLGIRDQKVLSGGFMAFEPDKVEHYFLNIYNEDWIWQLLHLQSKDFIFIGEVFQEITDPFENYSKKIVYQEFGEIALDGILNSFKSDYCDLLIDFSFWKNVLQKRQEYLNTIIAISSKMNKQEYLTIIKNVKSVSVELNADLFCKLYYDYFEKRPFFLKVYNEI